MGMSDDGRQRVTPKQQRFYLVNEDGNLPETGQLKHGKLGRDYCLFMKPAEFLKLTPKMGFGDDVGTAGLFEQDIKCIKDIIGWLKDDGVGVLNLWVRERGSSSLCLPIKRRFIVDNHDGRHRAAAAVVLGIERVPVKVRIDRELNAAVDENDLKEFVPQWNSIGNCSWPNNELYLKCVKELREQTLYDRKNIVDIGGGMIGAWISKEDDDQ